MIWLVILLSCIFGTLGGVLGGMVLEAYFQRRATDVVSDFGEPTSYETGKRRAG